MASKEQKATYEKILTLFDESERMLDDIEDADEAGDPELDIEEVAENFLPFIKQVNESAEDLAQVYVKFVEDKDNIGKGDIIKIRAALHSIVISLAETNQKLTDVKS